MAVALRINKRGVLTRFRTLINSQRFHSPTPPKGVMQDHMSPETDSDNSACRAHVDISKWKTLDSRKFGITRSKISHPSRIVLNLLWNKGFKSYLVGGCVRDLLLNRTPKDFDVITTATLTEVRKIFRGAQVVGRRFPVCLVHIKGSLVEVTSFETAAQTSKGKDKFSYSMLPKCCNKEDLIRCKNSLHRDFTVNSLFYDPFGYKIYDYANGIADLRSLKLETVIPAQMSFKEDPGRILRGFRIAARLGLSLSREIEAAISTYSSLVKSLDKSRIMIELNYMLSYGAAEPSLRLLWKFNLLEFLLPLHAAYLDKQANKDDGQASNMLMKLFFHLDNLVACDRPSSCILWIGLLAFHMALVNNPQNAVVVWALASVLYRGEWEEGVRFAKEHAEICVNFAPEIRMSSIYKSDEEIARGVSKLASLVMDSIPALVESNRLLQSMSRYQSLPQSGLVFVPRKTGQLVYEIFEVLVNDVEFYRSERKSSKIDYDILGQGHLSETRYVFGKIVIETMSSGIVADGEDFGAEKSHIKTEDNKEIGQLQLSDQLNHQLMARKDKRRHLSTPNPEGKHKKIKKQKLAESGSVQKTDIGRHELFEKFEFQETNEEHQKGVKLCEKVDLSLTKESVSKKKDSHRKHMINNRKKTANKSSSDQARHLKKVGHNIPMSSQSTESKNLQVINDKFNIGEDATTTNDSKEKERQQPHKSKNRKKTANRSSSDQARHLKMVEHNTSMTSQSKNLQVIEDKFDISVDATTTNDSKKKERQQPHKSKKSRPALSSLFKE